MLKVLFASATLLVGLALVQWSAAQFCALSRRWPTTLCCSRPSSRWVLGAKVLYWRRNVSDPLQSIIRPPLTRDSSLLRSPIIQGCLLLETWSCS